MFWNIISSFLKGPTLSKMFHFHAYFFMFTTLHTSTPIPGVHYGTWNYHTLMLRYQKGKNGWETTEKQQRIVLRLVEQRKHCLSLARKSFKIRENIKRKWEARSTRRKQEVSSQNGRAGISLEFHCKFFFSWNQSGPDMFFWNLKSQMVGPLWPLFTSHCNQIGKCLKKPGRRAYSVSRASRDLSSESWCKTQWKTGFYILV